MFEKANLYLPPGRMIHKINTRPGLVPIDVDPEKQELVWFDIGQHQLTESFFFASTEGLIAAQERPELFGAEIGLLAADKLSVDSLYPAGFIFHMGRCGSTLLSKALARPGENIVISEAPPHFLIWPLLTGSWLKPPKLSHENTQIFRNLVLTMGRKRAPDQRAHFIKFTTYTVLFFDFITSVFPDVPCLFLYRDPAEVLVSFLRHGPGWEALKDTEFGALTTGCSVAQVRAMSRLAYIERFLTRFLSAALSAPTDKLALLNYTHLTPANLPIILGSLNYSPNAGQLALMQKQFDYYSRDDSDSAKFVSDTADKQDAITPEIRRLVARELDGLYDRLERSESNLGRLLT